MIIEVGWIGGAVLKEAITRSLLLAALASAGIGMNKPKTALRVISRAAEEHADQLRERIADAIEASTIL